MTGCKRRLRQGGFSLLEVLIAFSILAISMGVLLQIFSRAMSTTAISGEYSRAATLVEAKLNAVGIEFPLEEGTYSGDPDDGMEWQVDIFRYEIEGYLADQSLVTPYQINATVLWGGKSKRRTLTITTLRLGEVF